MGGGGAMKAAAKAAGAGVLNGGYRTIPSENQVRTAARQIPVALLSAGEDWEFVGGGGEKKAVAGKMVFAGAPTVQEAKEATAELKEVIDKAYLSSPTVPIWGLSCVSMPLNTKIIDRVTRDDTPAVPKNALKAFKLLSGNPAAQAVVASIACDANVWNAVLQNEALVEFLQSNTLDKNSEPYTDYFFKSSKMDQSFDYTEVLKKSVQNIKTIVVDMVSNFSDYFNELFSIPADEQSLKTIERDGDSVAPVEVAKLMGLVVMVIAIIFLKRD